MAGLPKKYAKMGFKRGWAAYNKKRIKKRSKTKNKAVSIKMARRRKGYRRHYKRSRSGGGVSFGNITKVLIGAGLAAVYEVFVSPMIPLDGLIKNVAELVAGLFLAGMPGIPMPIKSFGMALGIINAYALVMAYMPSGGVSGSVNNGW